jgi:hypothetical protein
MPRLKSRYMAAPLSAAATAAPASQPSNPFSLTLKQAATYTGLTLRSLRRGIYSGNLKPVGQQKPFIFLSSELERYVQSGAPSQEVA